MYLSNFLCFIYFFPFDFGFFFFSKIVRFFCVLLGDTLTSGGFQRKVNDNEPIGNDIIEKFQETTTPIGDFIADDRQITLPLTDESNQSSIKKVTDTKCD